jgi:hypothetical protein
MQATRSQQLIETPAIRLIAVVVLAFAAGTIAGSTVDVDLPFAQGASVAVGDHRYDSLEDTRADRGLSVPAGDRRYDALEDTRADRGLPVPAGDRRYDALEDTRADRGID